MAKQKPLTDKQKKFLRLFDDNAGNVSMTCSKFKMNRSTFYLWMDTSTKFKESVEDVREGLIDFAESKLMMNIKDGKEASIFFLLRTLGKSRGYVERQEFQHEGNLTLETIMMRNSARMQKINDSNIRKSENMTASTIRYPQKM